MQLTYRGVQYEYRPTAVSREGFDRVVFGKYRGLHLLIEGVQSVAIKQPMLTLKYRGTTPVSAMAIAQ